MAEIKKEHEKLQSRFEWLDNELKHSAVTGGGAADMANFEADSNDEGLAVARNYQVRLGCVGGVGGHWRGRRPHPCPGTRDCLLLLLQKPWQKVERVAAAEESDELNEGAAGTSNY